MSPRGDKPCIGGKIRAFPIAQFSTKFHQPSKIHKHRVQFFIIFYFSNLITETIKQFVILFMMLEM